MKNETIRIRVDDAEKETFEQAASLAGVSLSAWVRERLRKAARLELEEAGRQIPFLQQLRKPN
jgi:antitoxin component of RelBE/YafQ-DinJ toxin-antitoxin module